MADYTRQIKRALNMIKAYGGTISIIRPASGGTYDAATDAYTGASAAVTISTYGAMFNYSESYLANSAIKRGDKQIIISSKDLSFTLRQGDLIYKGGTKWQVVNPFPLMPDGAVAIIYEAQCRN